MCQAICYYRFYGCNITRNILLYFHKNRIVQNTKEKYICLKYEIFSITFMRFLSMFKNKNESIT